MLQKQGYVPAWLASRLACKFNSTMRKTFLFWQIAIIVCFKTWNLIHRKHIQDALRVSDTSPVNWAAEIVPVFFVIHVVCLCPNVKTVTGISVFAADTWNIFSAEGKMPSLSLWNRHPAISHSVTLSLACEQAPVGDSRVHSRANGMNR